MGLAACGVGVAVAEKTAPSALRVVCVCVAEEGGARGSRLLLLGVGGASEEAAGTGGARRRGLRVAGVATTVRRVSIRIIVVRLALPAAAEHGEEVLALRLRITGSIVGPAHVGMVGWKGWDQEDEAKGLNRREATYKRLLAEEVLILRPPGPLADLAKLMAKRERKREGRRERVDSIGAHRGRFLASLRGIG